MKRLEKDIEEIRKGNVNSVFLQYVAISEENKLLNKELHMTKYQLSNAQEKVDGATMNLTAESASKQKIVAQMDELKNEVIILASVYILH